MARDSYGVTRRHQIGVTITGNAPLDPAQQVSAADIRTARDVIHRMVNGGELLSSSEAGMLRNALWVLETSAQAADTRLSVSS